jgi:hypothetical protein
MHATTHLREEIGCPIVGSDRGAVSALSAGPFPRPALRTGRARSHASGSPRVHAAGLVVASPSVQLGLDLQYPSLGLVEIGPRRVGIHRRPPGLPVPTSRTRWAPSPCSRLSRPRTTTDPPPRPWVISRRCASPLPTRPVGRKATQRRFPRSPLTGRRDRCPAFPLQACPRLRRRPSSWPPAARRRGRPSRL